MSCNWNATALATTYVSPTELIATAPASDFATIGNASITVTNPTPGGGTSAGLTFQVLATPANVFVNAAWAGDALGTAVTWTDSSTHYVGYDAFGTIQTGIDTVAAGGTVNVAAGTYTETDVIAENLTVNGAGASLVTVNGAVRAASPTIDTGVSGHAFGPDHHRRLLGRIWPGRRDQQSGYRNPRRLHHQRQLRRLRRRPGPEQPRCVRGHHRLHDQRQFRTGQRRRPVDPR